MVLWSHLLRFLHRLRLLMPIVIPHYTASDSCTLKLYSFYPQELRRTKEKRKICSSPAKFTFQRQHKPRKKCDTLLDHEVGDAPSLSFTKILLSSGLFTFLTAQQALAGPDVASSLQSLPFLGDAGDLSTGFASVRKFSLLTCTIIFMSPSICSKIFITFKNSQSLLAGLLADIFFRTRG